MEFQLSNVFQADCRNVSMQQFMMISKSGRFYPNKIKYDKMTVYDLILNYDSKQQLLVYDFND